MKIIRRKICFPMPFVGYTFNLVETRLSRLFHRVSFIAYRARPRSTTFSLFLPVTRVSSDARNAPAGPIVHQQGEVRSVKVGIKGAGISEVVPLPHLHLDAVDPAVIGIHARDGDSSWSILEVFPFERDGLYVGVFVFLAGESQDGQGDSQGRDAEYAVCFSCHDDGF
jgi:hypothetical protein